MDAPCSSRDIEGDHFSDIGCVFLFFNQFNDVFNDSIRQRHRGSINHIQQRKRSRYHPGQPVPELGSSSSVPVALAGQLKWLAETINHSLELNVVNIHETASFKVSTLTRLTIWSLNQFVSANDFNRNEPSDWLISIVNMKALALNKGRWNSLVSLGKKKNKQKHHRIVIRLNLWLIYSQLSLIEPALNPDWRLFS